MNALELVVVAFVVGYAFGWYRGDRHRGRVLMRWIRAEKERLDRETGGFHT